jgi:hypothetical protein
VDFDELAAALRARAAGRASQAAAVELLAWHESWLRRASFIRACVRHDGEGLAEINWAKARAFHASGPRGSTSELDVLDLAIAIGEDRYGLTQKGTQHRVAIVRAIATALSIEAPPAGRSSVTWSS